MKVIQFAAHLFPRIGWAQSHIWPLFNGLKMRGIDVSVVTVGEAGTSRMEDGIMVHFTGSGPDAEKNIQAIVEQENPDLFHVHTSGGEVSAELLRGFKRRQISTVLTYHICNFTCLRGDLQKWGTELCDGLIDEQVCGSCVISQKGVPIPLAGLMMKLPLDGLKKHFTGKVSTALGMPTQVRNTCAELKQRIHVYDQIIALSDWSRTVLIKNETPAENITLCPIGISHSPQPPLGKPRTANAPQRLVYVGRTHPYKGIQLLVQALKENPTLRLKIDLFGISIDDTERKHLAHVLMLAADDSRITWRGGLANAEVISTLAQYDALLVPSLVPETGPQVALEAFAAGIPVIGNRRGGLAELIRNGVDGLTVPDATVEGWKAVFSRVEDGKLLAELRTNVRPPRSMDDVINDNFAVYDLLRKKNA